MTRLRVTEKERDALYQGTLDHLSGLGDLAMVIEAGDYEEASRLGRDFCDDLRFVLDDLGWGEGPGETVELTTPPDVLSRLLPRLESQAREAERQEEEERATAIRQQAENQSLREACRRLLEELGECS